MIRMVNRIRQKKLLFCRFYTDMMTTNNLGSWIRFHKLDKNPGLSKYNSKSLLCGTHNQSEISNYQKLMNAMHISPTIGRIFIFSKEIVKKLKKIGFYSGKITLLVIFIN